MAGNMPVIWQAWNRPNYGNFAIVRTARTRRRVLASGITEAQLACRSAAGSWTSRSRSTGRQLNRPSDVGGGEVASYQPLWRNDRNLVNVSDAAAELSATPQAQKPR